MSWSKILHALSLIRGEKIETYSIPEVRVDHMVQGQL